MRRKDLLAQCVSVVNTPLEESTQNNSSCENSYLNFQHDQVWKIIPSSTPKMIKRCSRCSSDRFSSSDKFRVNAHKKVIDAWLIYKCDNCEFTLKFPIISRKPVSKINQDLFRKLQANDHHLAWHYAFNLCQHQKELSVDWNIDFAILVQSDNEKSKNNQRNMLKIMIESDFFLKINLFSILRQKLECSRNQIERLHAQSELEVYNFQGNAIKLKALIGMGCLLRLSRGIVIAPSLSLIS